MSGKLDHVCLLLAALLLPRCTRDFSVLPKVETVRELTQTERRLVESDNRFGFRLFKEIAKAESDENIFISPLSVAMALGMTYNGAAGTTEEAMRTTLEFGDMTFQEINESFRSLITLLSQLDPMVEFRIANSIWYRLGFQVEQEFVELNRTFFDADVSALDFSSPDAPGVINGWVEQHTNGRIEEIIDQIDPLSVMFLIDAIYFKGTWTYEFDENLTADDFFTKPDGSQVSCKMMMQEGDFQYLATEAFEAVDLPYGGGKFSMTILLPRPAQSLDSLIAELTPEVWAQWLGGFSTSNATLYLPKFTLEYDVQLNHILIALGMEVAFNPDEADFTRINRDGGLYVSRVKHKTFVEVDEEGTEAAAATSVEISVTSVGFSVRVDRPCVFVIREHHSQTILFMGKIVEPRG